MGQIAKAAGLARTITHRIVGSLEAQQFVISAQNGMRLGPAPMRLAASAPTDIVAIAQAFIEVLGRKTRETVVLCVYRGRHAISVDQYACDQVADAG
ncbi:hypothetical protein G7009_25680 [Pseudomonas capeferrum]|uniref:hypothetical protein n=1 Tax=Pseudomonas capeferrum TaxID=1495066 RepID=UPI0015E2DF4A|nr:hypothetical protein [Pseudomonas capeferrum]MBA1205108.1 hypothetical protein [Pseudomonas capeferrum]